MQRGLTNIRPIKVLGANDNPDPTDTRQVLFFNNSGVNLWIGDDENSATVINGLPILAGAEKSFLWNSELWIGADNDNTEFRYLVSPHFAGKAGGTQTWEELGRATPPPPKYYNRPAGR